VSHRRLRPGAHPGPEHDWGRVSLDTPVSVIVALMRGLDNPACQYPVGVFRAPGTPVTVGRAGESGVGQVDADPPYGPAGGQEAAGARWLRPWTAWRAPASCRSAPIGPLEHLDPRVLVHLSPFGARRLQGTEGLVGADALCCDRVHGILGHQAREPITTLESGVGAPPAPPRRRPLVARARRAASGRPVRSRRPSYRWPRSSSARRRRGTRTRSRPSLPRAVTAALPCWAHRRPRPRACLRRHRRRRPLVGRARRAASGRPVRFETPFIPMAPIKLCA